MPTYASTGASTGSVRTRAVAIDIVHVAVVVVAGLLVALLATGTPLLLSIQVAAYCGAIFAAAGFGFSALPCFGEGSVHYRAALSLVLGISIVPTLAFLTYAAGVLTLTNYIVVGFLAATSIWLRPTAVEYRPVDLSKLYGPVIVASILAPLGVMTLADVAGVTDHRSMQVIVAQALQQPWPPQSSFASGVPIAYHYGLHLILYLISATTGVDLDALADTAAPTLFLWFAIWGITTITSYWLRLSTLAYVAMATVVFGVFGFAQPLDLLSVLRTIPFTGVLTLSPLLGHLIMVVSLFVFVRSVEAEGRGAPVATLLLLAMLGFSASIVRAGASGVLLACTASAMWLYWVAVKRRIEIWPTAATFVVGVTTVAGVVLTLGLPGSFSGANFLTFSAIEGITFIGGYQHMAYVGLAESLRLPFFVTGMVGVAVSLALAAGFLSPPFWEFVFRWRSIRPAACEVALLLAFVLASAITFVTVAPGASHLVINQTGYCCSAILGARALDYWLDNKAPSARGRWLRIIGAATIGLLVVHVGWAVNKVATTGGVSHLFVARDPGQRTGLGEEMDLGPVLAALDDPSEVHFILPSSSDFTMRTTYNLMAKHDLKLLAYEGFLRLSANYGGSSAERLTELKSLVAAYKRQIRNGVTDLGLARAVIEGSVTPHARVVVISPRDLKVVPEPSFAQIAETPEFIAWIYLPNEPR